MGRGATLGEYNRCEGKKEKAHGCLDWDLLLMEPFGVTEIGYNYMFDKYCIYQDSNMSLS